MKQFAESRENFAYFWVTDSRVVVSSQHFNCSVILYLSLHFILAHPFWPFTYFSLHLFSFNSRNISLSPPPPLSLILSLSPLCFQFVRWWQNINWKRCRRITNDIDGERKRRRVGERGEGRREKQSKSGGEKGEGGERVRKWGEKERARGER